MPNEKFFFFSYPTMAGRIKGIHRKITFKAENKLTFNVLIPSPLLPFPHFLSSSDC